MDFNTRIAVRLPPGVEALQGTHQQSKATSAARYKYTFRSSRFSPGLLNRHVRLPRSQYTLSLCFIRLFSSTQVGIVQCDIPRAYIFRCLPAMDPWRPERPVSPGCPLQVPLSSSPLWSRLHPVRVRQGVPDFHRCCNAHQLTQQIIPLAL